MTELPTVQELFDEEIRATGLDPDHLDKHTYDTVQAMTPVLDGVLASLEGKPEALRVAAAVLRSYARMTDQYVAALDAAR